MKFLSIIPQILGGLLIIYSTIIFIVREIAYHNVVHSFLGGDMSRSSSHAYEELIHAAPKHAMVFFVLGFLLVLATLLPIIIDLLIRLVEAEKSR